jgi:LAO/AO transport system kinase
MLVAVARVGAADHGHHGPGGAADATGVTVPDGMTPMDPPAAGAMALVERPRPKQPEVLVTTATTGEGIPELLASLDRHRAAGHVSSVAASRLARAEAQVWAILADRLRDRLHAAAARPGTEETLRAVAEHRLDPYAAADRLLGRLEDLGRSGT